MTKMCRAVFKYLNNWKLVGKINTQLCSAQSNESPCRKSGRIGIEQVSVGRWGGSPEPCNGLSYALGHGLKYFWRDDDLSLGCNLSGTALSSPTWPSSTSSCPDTRGTVAAESAPTYTEDLYMYIYMCVYFWERRPRCVTFWFHVFGAKMTFSWHYYFSLICFSFHLEVTYSHLFHLWFRGKWRK